MIWLEKLPTLSTVGVLAVIFACLERQVRSATSRFWKIAWFLIFIHFFAQLLEPENGGTRPLLVALDWGALQLSAVAFVVSVSAVVEDRVKRNCLLAILGLPSLAYVVLGSYEVKAPWPYVLCLAACFAGGIGFWLRMQRVSTGTIGFAALAGIIGVWGIQGAMHRNFDPGATALLGLGFAMPGILLFRNHWRASAGIITIRVGFIFWGAIFPLGLLTDRLLPKAHIPAEIWNIPKMWVAFGMVLAIVEDLRRKDHEQNVQMQRFSAITSQLLSGTAVDSLCAEIARAITEVTTFRCAAIYLLDPEQGLRVAGTSGIPKPLLTELREMARQRTAEDITESCSGGRMIGRNSFALSNQQSRGAYIPLKHGAEYAANPHWSTGNELLIPLRSGYETCLGCVALREPGNAKEVTTSGLARIELLAADLAMAVELMKSIQGQMIRADKLAALGRLVAGVAHELNNPLAAVIGYGELLGTEASIASARVQSGKLLGEARRMQRIVESLLRFSRQGPKLRSVVDIAPVIHETLALHEYHRRPAGLKTMVEIQPGIPPVMVNEDQFKQVLLNLLTNAADAVEESNQEKQITLRVFEREAKAVIQLEDTGPGFSNLNRAFDPFYTTKPLGKGTGLGLSICYGIIKEHGGDIRLENLSRGARVTVELPLADKSQTSFPDLAFPILYHSQSTVIVC